MAVVITSSATAFELTGHVISCPFVTLMGIVALPRPEA